MHIDFEELSSSLSMTEIIRLQNTLSKALVRRFEKPMAVCFSDVVGSTAYFARFGDEAGRKLQQRHFDLLQATVPKVGGRVVDTAGDGAFLVFPTVDAAADALIEFQQQLSLDNLTHPRDHQLSIRCGIHWGPVLTDGVAVTGDNVNLGARVASTADGGEIRLTRDAFVAFSNLRYRLKCRALPPAPMKGIQRPVELMLLEWRDWSLFPESVRIEETGETFKLPSQDTISFGRLREHDGIAANDIVVQLADKLASQKISRWHFELRRRPEGFVLYPLSDQSTEVDGKLVPKGASVAIKPGSSVKLGQVATLRFVARTMNEPEADGQGTIFQL
jgi:class 3 adenylate cyclase